MAQTTCLTIPGYHPKVGFRRKMCEQVTIHGSGAWTGDDFRHAVDLVQSVRVDRKPLIPTSTSLPMPHRLRHAGAVGRGGRSVAKAVKLCLHFAKSLEEHSLALTEAAHL